MGTVCPMNPTPKATGGGIPGPAEIAEALAEHGQFVTTVHPRPAQRLVDLNWAAHQAGRMVGVQVRVLVEKPLTRSPDLTVKVIPRQRARLPAGRH